MPDEWLEYGARWGRDGLLYLGEWKRGFTVHELRAMFFHCQQVRSLEVDLRQARAELARLVEENSALAQRAAFYRRQCTLEAGMGLALARIAS